VIAAESKAYGFALVLWGTGAVVESSRGRPTLSGAIAYVGGALVAMALVVLATFGGPLGTWQARSYRRYAAGAVHLVSTAAAIGSGAGVAAAIGTGSLAFLGAGFTAVLVYQLLLGGEVMTSIADDDERPVDDPGTPDA
jgi:hypothetical protein